MMPPFMDGELYRRTPYKLTKFDKLLVKSNIKMGKWSLFGWKTILQCKLTKSHMSILIYPITANDGFFCKIYCSRCGLHLSTGKLLEGNRLVFTDIPQKESTK